MKLSWKQAAGIFALASALLVPTFAGAHGGPGGPGGFGRGGWWRELTGTVSAVNATANTLSVAAKVGRSTTPVTLTVPATAPIIRYTTVGIAGLKTGDTIRVAGLPLSIQATAIQASSLNSDSTGETPPTGNTTSGTTGSASAPTGLMPNDGPGHPGPRSGASATGTVQSVDATKNQVIVTLSDGTAVTVNVPADLQITRQDSVTLADVQAGDLLRARVTSDASGNLTVVTLELKAAVTSTTGTTTGATPGATG